MAYRVISSSSESDSDSYASSDNEELIDVEDDGAGPAMVIRGAEPYRYEPPAPAPAPAHQADVDVAGHAVERHAEPNNRLGNIDWCTCGRCLVEEDVVTCRCCAEVPEMVQKLDETNVGSVSCFTEHPWFEATCLNPGTLQTAYYGYRQQYGARAVEGERDKKFRHVAYRQVVRWCWGFLGRHNRVPLPSCVMRVVRETYPDPHGTFKGFQYPPLEEL